jgi:hypothetical protein
MPMQVYQFGMLAADASYFVVCAYSKDATAFIVYCDGLNSWLSCIHRVDIAIQIGYYAHSVFPLLSPGRDNAL